MFDLLSRFLNTPSPKMMKDLIEKGAELIDVRTREEFNAEHAEGSKNIPLDEIMMSLSQFDKEKTYILVCASGIRSRNAMNLLKRQGFINTYNGGSWASFVD